MVFAIKKLQTIEELSFALNLVHCLITNYTDNKI